MFSNQNQRKSLQRSAANRTQARSNEENVTGLTVRRTEHHEASKRSCKKAMPRPDSDRHRQLDSLDACPLRERCREDSEWSCEPGSRGTKNREPQRFHVLRTDIERRARSLKREKPEHLRQIALKGPIHLHEIRTLYRSTGAVSRVIQIRDVPDEVHDALVEAAQAQGLSLTRYILRELEHLAKPAQVVHANADVV